MAFCTTCGNEIDDKASICVKCGVPVAQNTKPTQSSEDETLWAVLGSIGVCALMLIIPIFGVILGIALCAIFWSSKPKAAKAIGITTGITIVLYILLLVGFMVFALTLP